jgi:hypothetical protein
MANQYLYIADESHIGLCPHEVTPTGSLSPLIIQHGHHPVKTAACSRDIPSQILRDIRGQNKARRCVECPRRNDAHHTICNTELATVLIQLLLRQAEISGAAKHDASPAKVATRLGRVATASLDKRGPSAIAAILSVAEVAVYVPLRSSFHGGLSISFCIPLCHLCSYSRQNTPTMPGPLRKHLEIGAPQPAAVAGLPTAMAMSG